MDGSLELQWPAAAKMWFDQLILVGSVYDHGPIWRSGIAGGPVLNQAQLSTVVDVWAPGYQVECARNIGPADRGMQSGSIFSASM